uniref:Peptidase S1 domain-containing protein n=1 Tax=Anopheles dirus TaxID=7168 RepID=A0A182N3I1_9DIPT
MASLQSGTIYLVLLCCSAAAANVVVTSERDISCTTPVNEPGICVYQYECVDGVISQSGENIIDVRQLQDDCQDYMMVCCAEPIAVTTLPSVDDERKEEPIRSTTMSVTSTTDAASAEGRTSSTTPRAVPKPKRPELKIPSYDVVGCGHRNPNGVIFSIQNNQLSESEYGEYPWSVAILSRDSPDEAPQYRCGGALIDRAAVLTTASCLYRYRFQVSSLVVRLGEWDMSTVAEPLPHVDADVEKIHLHPQFQESSKINDIAIIVLRETIELNHTIGVVCLPPATIDIGVQDVVGVGWGDVPKFVEKAPQTILKKSHLRSIVYETCQSNLRKLMGRQYRLDRGFLCAQANDLEMLPCTGDTGSPYVSEVVPGQERYHLVGLVSWGYHCNKQTFPTVLTNVARYRGWVDEVIRSEGLDERSYVYEEEEPASSEEE